MNSTIKCTYIPTKYTNWWMVNKFRKGVIGSHVLMRSQLKEGILISFKD